MRTMRLTAERNLNIPPSSHLLGCATCPGGRFSAFGEGEDYTYGDPGAIYDPGYYDPGSSLGDATGGGSDPYLWDNSGDNSAANLAADEAALQGMSPSGNQVADSAWLATLNTGLQTIMLQAIKTGGTLLTASLTSDQKTAVQTAWAQGKLPGYQMDANGNLVPIKSDNTMLIVIIGAVVLGGIMLARSR